MTAFLAGMAALFAPCCITVLLPAYLASIFRQKTKVFFMTFVFFLGVFLIFLPLGLGFGAIGRLFNQLHDFIYFFGGIFLIGLGASIFLGLHFMLPFHVSPGLKKHNIPSIFALGIFSGLATTCCAPVLAGVLALSILPGSIFWGAMYALVYVLGMVMPLFIIALFLDKINFTDKFLTFKKMINYRILGRNVILTLGQLFASLMFVFMGGLIVFLTLTDRLKMESDALVSVNLFVAKYLYLMKGAIQKMPWFIIPTLFIFIFLIILKKAVKQTK